MRKLGIKENMQIKPFGFKEAIVCPKNKQEVDPVNCMLRCLCYAGHGYEGSNGERFIVCSWEEETGWHWRMT